MKTKQSYLYLVYMPVLFAAFFVLHGYNENFGLIPGTVLLSLFLEYTAIGVLVFLALAWLFRIKEKRYLGFALFLILYFFFGSIKDFFLNHFYSTGIHRYQYFLPLIGVLLTVCFIWIYRTSKPFQRFPRYFTSLLILLLALESGIFCFKVFSGAAHTQDFGDRDNMLINGKRIPDSLEKPDIYWLVFDMYPSSQSLLQDWQYANSLDTVLLNRGFYIAGDAISNYNYTHYSLASILDMSYLEGLDTGKDISARDEVRGDRTLKKNNVTAFLSSNGYFIHNFSFYDLEEASSKGYSLFRDYPSDLIDDQTLSKRVYKDILWNLSAWFSNNRENWDSAINISNVHLHDSLQKDLLQKALADWNNPRNKRPSFFLLHVFLPHEPFIYKEDGSLQTKAQLSPAVTFVPQVKYTNKIIQQLVDSIQKTSSGKAVIIVQGDHGYKYEETDKRFESSSSRIFYSLYLPSRNYKSWYPSISGVNSFRLLFNTLFDSGFPILKDSSILLRHHRR